MINSITVINHRDESKKFVLADPWSSGFAITNIDGLGPVKADVSMTDITSLDGAIFNSARSGMRNIVISCLFVENPTIEETRLESYRYFPIKKPITLQIETDIRTYMVKGYVESNTPTIFSSAEGCEISIICPESYFTVLDESREFGGEVGSLQEFEFPFSNESLTSNLIEFSVATTQFVFEVLYKGRIETGLIFHLHVVDTLSSPANVIIEKVGTTDFMTLTPGSLPGGGFQAGDELVVSTIPGKKRITLIRSGESTNATKILSRNSKWLKIEPGMNYFRINTPLVDLGMFEIRFEYEPLYEGV